jgi:glycosyltransferase involved in cell wall biosynthesis
MKISILILTHKRPELFQRCLKSALKDIPENVEILVLNDSNEISEIEHNSVKYFYKEFDNLSKNYEFLLKEAIGEYVYYLEDDDYLHSNFYSIIDDLNGVDIIGGNYYPTWNDEWILKCTNSMSKEFKLDNETFQLGQFIFKRELALKFNFPNDSHIHNDRKLIEFIVKLSNIKLNKNKIFYFQTTDGKDNISFPESRNYYGTN